MEQKQPTLIRDTVIRVVRDPFTALWHSGIAVCFSVVCWCRCYCIVLIFTIVICVVTALSHF